MNGVEAVEGADGSQPQLATLGSARIDVIEMLEVGCVLDGSVDAQRMPAVDLSGMTTKAAEEYGGEGEENDVSDKMTQGRRLARKR